MQGILKKVLCVDDDEDILQIAKITLEDLGNFEVFTCSSGKDALECAQQFHPDLILMDIMMPEMDGVSALKLLRNNHIAAPVIFLTAKVQQNEINEYISVGGAGVIKKPFDPMKLCDEIQAIWKEAKTSVPTKENKIDQLLNVYLEHLKEYEITLKEAIYAIKNSVLTDELKQKIQHIAHKLAGSGATYGFEALSKAARELDMALIEQNDKELFILLEALLKHCAQTFKQGKTPSPEQPTSASSTPCVLLVDDSSETVEQLQNILDGKIKLIIETDREQIISLIQKNFVDLMLLNIRAKLQPLRLVETLCAIPACASVPILMLLPLEESNQAINFIMAGAADYLILPLQPDMVAKKIVERLKHIRTTIMIVDDDITIRELLAHKFQILGCQVLLAANGEEALRIAHMKVPDLIILDYMMPGLDGGAVLQKMRKNLLLSEVPVIFLTAKQQEEDILEAFKIGAADYITKPFIPEEVVVRCFNLLELYKRK